MGMENDKKYYKDNRNAAFALVTFFGSVTVLMWVAFPQHQEIHLKYTWAIVPMLVGMLSIGSYYQLKLRKLKKRKR